RGSKPHRSDHHGVASHRSGSTWPRLVEHQLCGCDHVTLSRASGEMIRRWKTFPTSIHVMLAIASRMQMMTSFRCNLENWKTFRIEGMYRTAPSTSNVPVVIATTG